MKDIFGNYRSWLLAEQQNSIFQHNKEVLQTATIGVADESAYNHVVHFGNFGFAADGTAVVYDP